MGSSFWENAEKMARKVNGYVEKRYEENNARYKERFGVTYDEMQSGYQRTLADKSDSEIRRMKQNPNPNWNAMQKRLVEEEYNKRGL